MKQKLRSLRYHYWSVRLSTRSRYVESNSLCTCLLLITHSNMYWQTQMALNSCILVEPQQYIGFGDHLSIAPQMFTVAIFSGCSSIVDKLQICGFVTPTNHFNLLDQMPAYNKYAYIMSTCLLQFGVLLPQILNIVQITGHPLVL